MCKGILNIHFINIIIIVRLLSLQMRMYCVCMFRTCQYHNFFTKFVYQITHHSSIIDDWLAKYRFVFGTSKTSISAIWHVSFCHVMCASVCVCFSVTVQKSNYSKYLNLLSRETKSNTNENVSKRLGVATSNIFFVITTKYRYCICWNYKKDFCVGTYVYYIINRSKYKEDNDETP